jgi:polysaccharide deacetylase family protein (PEP-CTERM system associated)
VTLAAHAFSPAAVPLLLSVDFEDWHQLVRRRLDLPGWEQVRPALPRQTTALLDLFDELGVRATFFVLGMAARAYPRLVQEIAERGHEIGCHGDRHLAVFSQSPAEFAADLRAARETIEAIANRRVGGYRAPAFSITSDCRSWAYRVLVEEGFVYDASQRHGAQLRGRTPAVAEPRPLRVDGATLWEFPVAAWRTRHGSIPVGGASYWSLIPTGRVLRGLEQAGPMAGLYVHPYELDPEPLRVRLPGNASLGQRLRGAMREAQRNLARRRAPGVLRAVASRHRLMPYGDAYAQLARRPPKGS